jgi:anion-transporting  ArsA/GET3 family ATPase
LEQAAATDRRTGPLARLLDRDVVVVVGAGGVGKTTLSAALGVAAAQRGRRALVLTVDPARRLANALGLRSIDEHVQTLTVADFAAMGCAVAVDLDVAMLDVKSTFDRVVRRHASSEAHAQTIMDNPFYRTASTALAGSQEYMAMVRLYEVVLEGNYDVVILDTPPSAHALDFLDAPRRMTDLFASRSFRLLLRPFQTGGSVVQGVFSPNSLVMRGLGRFTSVDTFHDILAFFAALSDTFDGFVARAQDVVALLGSDRAGFAVVATPDDNARAEATFLFERLLAEGFHIDAWLMNRVSALSTLDGRGRAEVGAALTRVLAAIDDDAAHSDAPETADADDIVAVVAARAYAMARLAAADQAHVEAASEGVARDVAVVPLARRADEPADLSALHSLANELWHAEAHAGPRRAH